MPYVTTDRRKALLKNFPTHVDKDSVPQKSGELNFLITEVLLGYLANHGTSYSTINDIIGALEGAKLEFYRRVAAPYEDKKIQENGDVY